MSMNRYSTTRLLFGSALVLALAACGDDPAPFNAQGTSSDMSAVSSAFDSPATESFGYFGDAMDDAFSAPALSSSFRAVKQGAEAAGMFASARRLGESARSMTRPVTVALAVIPDEYLGNTYEYSESTNGYELSDRTGAPANGVRFIVYAVNPITGIPVTPLQEIGYADVLDESTATNNSLRVLLVSDGTTYLNYGVTGSLTQTEARATVDGFVTNGTTQVDFNLDNVASDAQGGTVSLDYELDVPSRDVALDYLIVVTNTSSNAANAAVDLFLSGPNGSVGIDGGLVEGTGELTANVNGDAFAVMEIVDEEAESITKPDGTALTLEEYGALFSIWALVLKGFDVFEDLLDPVDNLF
jgi:hypothetical protein